MHLRSHSGKDPICRRVITWVRAASFFGTVLEIARLRDKPDKTSAGLTRYKVRLKTERNVDWGLEESFTVCSLCGLGMVHLGNSFLPSPG